MIRAITSEVITHLEWRYLQLRYLFTSESLTRSVRGETATFKVDSFQEFLRITDYQDEDYVIAKLLSRAQSEDVFWDVGANIGTHSCYVGKKVNEVVSFEPHPSTASRAATNIEQNNVNGKVFEYALGECEKISTLKLPSSDESVIGVGTFTLQGPKNRHDALEVEVRSGDRLISECEFSPPDIVKIDVEGAEVEVLQGAKRGLAVAHTVFVEVHPEHTELNTVINLLEKEDFSVEILRNRNSEIHIMGVKPMENN